MLRGHPSGTELSRLVNDLQLIGQDAAFADVLRKLVRVASYDIPVLLTGETGTGKDLCARAIHHLSGRRARSFVPVDCGALPRTLFEREMFGHTRRAFTDAYREQRGLVAMADGGSILLDEVDTLSMEAQSALLRVLEDGTYRPIGAERFSTVNVRVISASNVDLDRAVGEGRFRADLFFRLAGVRLRLPALRERRQDIRLLAEHFLRIHRSHDEEVRAFTDEAIRSLESYAWPGNIRELVNVIRNAIVFSTDGRIEADDLNLPPPVERDLPATLRAARAQLLGRFERQYLDDLLRRCQGNLTHASREAGQDRRALGRLVKKHALDPRAYHARPAR
jgi:DNA-binding NtrC family response regulator